MREGAVALLWAGGGLVVVAKEAGVPTTGKTPETPGSLEFALAAQLGRRVWAVHQLDRLTSGCVVFTTRKGLVHPTAERLRRGQKTYLAVCEGRTKSRFVVSAPIGRRRSADGRKTFPAIPGHLGEGEVTELKEAETSFETLGSAADGSFSLVAAKPRTGRTHQIRLHLAAAGHPIAGEALHRVPPCDAAPRQLLHAWRIVLPGDGAEESQVFECPVPADFGAFLSAVGLQAPLEPV